MPHHVKTYRADTGITTRTYAVATSSEAVKQAVAEGFHVLAVDGANNTRKSYGQSFHLSLFSTELLALMQAGLNIVEAIETLAQRERKPQVAEILSALRQALGEGLTFSAALERYPQHFPNLFIATIRASERTGNLSDALDRYLQYRSKMDSARKKLVGALLYPSMIILVGACVVIFLLTFVIPRFSEVYGQLGSALPASTRFLLAWGKIVHAHGLLLLTAVVGVLGLLGVWLSRPWTRALLMRLIWRLPALGERLRLFQLARFYRTIGMLQLGGIPMVQSIGMAASLLQQPALSGGVHAAEGAIREGRPIADAFMTNNLTDEVAYRLLKVGEKSGDMGQMLTRIADFFDNELEKWLDWATKLFEPILMAVVGTVIGAIVLMMYLPIFELADGLQ